jgi:NAD(P)-dependent dehydrogenase (short-subunit alcohol dehydrogenase family)
MTETTSKDNTDLADRVCVVTGAGSGMGRAICLALARQGAKIAALDINLAGALETAALVTASGAEAQAFGCDTSDEAAVAAVAEQCALRLGSCKVLVNNAGILRPGPLDQITMAEWNRVLAVNLTGYFICAQAFGRQMRERPTPVGGAMVHIASISANQATANAGAYSVAKAGIQMLSRQLAVEWGAYGIRSNVVNPGLIVTPMSQAFYDQPGVTERRSQAVPVGRVGAPEDVAQAVVFLASARSAYISGQEIAVDGGFSQMLMSLIPRAGYEAAAGQASRT